MSDTPANQTSPTPESAPRCCNRRRGRRGWVAIFAIAAVGLLGFAAGRSHGAPWPWPGHWGFNQPDAEEITYFVQHRINKALSKVDATPEQHAKIDAIVKGTVSDVLALKKDPGQRREKIVAILKADTIDRAALEEIRAERLAAGETASKRIVQAVADIADVLKPEQRRELLTEWERWHPHPLP